MIALTSEPRPGASSLRDRVDGDLLRCAVHNTLRDPKGNEPCWGCWHEWHDILRLASWRPVIEVMPNIKRKLEYLVRDYPGDKESRRYVEMIRDALESK